MFWAPAGLATGAHHTTGCTCASWDLAVSGQWLCLWGMPRGSLAGGKYRGQATLTLSPMGPICPGLPSNPFRPSSPGGPRSPCKRTEREGFTLRPSLLP